MNNQITKEEIGELIGKFSWHYCLGLIIIFIETDMGNFVCESRGDNREIRSCTGTYDQWKRRNPVPFTKELIVCTIKEYVGDFTYNPEPINP